MLHSSRQLLATLVPSVQVMMLIANSPPPTLSTFTQATPQFHDLIASALVKDAQKRPSANDLLQHSFVRSATAAGLMEAIYSIVNATPASVHESDYGSSTEALEKTMVL